MLPPGFRPRDGLRVCLSCAPELQDEYSRANPTCPGDEGSLPCHASSSARRHHSTPFSMTLGSAILNATSTLEQLANPLLLRDQEIPSSLLQHAQGFAFLTLLRVGIGG